MRFIQDKGLAQLFGAAAAMVLIFPIINVYLIYPKYQAQMLSMVKHEARQVAFHLSHMAKMKDGHLWVDFTKEGEPYLLQDFGLMKIKVFDIGGRVIYSSDKQEVGTVNRHEYFQNVVARGQEFTKVVDEGELTSEGEKSSRDMVETYLPLMLNGTFVGAFELYYDISEHQAAFTRIYMTSLLYPVPLAFAFIVMVGFILIRLDQRNEERRRDQREIEAQSEALLLEHEKQRELLTAVERAKRQWEATMDRVGDMVLIVDAGMVVRRCNKAVTSLSRKSYAELLGRAISEIFPGLEADAVRDGAPFDYYHTPSGRWFSASVYRALEDHDDDGNVLTLHDQTEMKRVTAQLESRNQEILQNSRELQRAIDEISSLIQRVVVEEDFGTYFKTDLAKACYEAKKCDQEACPCFGKEAARCWQAAGTYCDGEVQGVFAQKYGSCAECDYFKVITSNPVNMIGEQFNNMMRVLEAKSIALKTAYSELKQTQGHLLQQEKMASIGQLAAGVAHEINNPVGFIASNLSSLLKYAGRIGEFVALEASLIAEAGNEDLTARQNDGRKKFKIDFILDDIDSLVKESLEGCDRVKKIVQDLKGFSRVDQATRQTVDIHECLDSTINIVWNELKYKATVEKDYQAATPITCFPQQLNQVFMNLLVNAAHAIEKKGVITVRTREDQSNLVVSIGDTGSGIPAEIIGHIFEPFFTTKEVGKGTGLGLSIVYDIVTKNHHGTIQVESEPGQGTTFTITIPFEQGE